MPASGGGEEEGVEEDERSEGVLDAHEARYRDKYRLVEHVRDDTKMGHNEMRITQQGKARGYVGYGVALFEVRLDNTRFDWVCTSCVVHIHISYLLKEKGARFITLKAMGRAINKVGYREECTLPNFPSHMIHTKSNHGSKDCFSHGSP